MKNIRTISRGNDGITLQFTDKISSSELTYSGIGEFKFNSPVVAVGGFVEEDYTREVIYVKADATGNNDGTSWDNAYTNVEDALVNLSDTHVKIYAGSYPITKSHKISGVKNLIIEGGFSDPNDANRLTNPTSSVFQGDGSLVNLFEIPTGENILIKNITIDNFGASTTSSSSSVVVVNDANVTFEGVRFSNITHGWGALRIDASKSVYTVNFNDCIFTDSAPQYYGGNLRGEGSINFNNTDWIEYLPFFGNFLTSENCSVSLDGCRMLQDGTNEQEYILVGRSSKDLNISNSTFIGDYDFGIYTQECTVILKNSVIYNNNAANACVFLTASNASTKIEFSNWRVYNCSFGAANTGGSVAYAKNVTKYDIEYVNCVTYNMGIANISSDVDAMIITAKDCALQNETISTGGGGVIGNADYTSSNIVLAPTVEDATNGNLRLTSDSTGYLWLPNNDFNSSFLKDNNLETDINGISRMPAGAPYNQAFSVGAYADGVTLTSGGSGGGAGETYFFGTFDAADTNVDTDSSKLIGTFLSDASVNTADGSLTVISSKPVSATGADIAAGYGGIAVGRIEGAYGTIQAAGLGTSARGHIGNENGQIYANQPGSSVGGSTTDYGYGYNAYIRNSAGAGGAFVHGRAYSYNSDAVLEANSSGSVAMGYAYGGTISSSGWGSIAFGGAYNEGYISAESEGSFAHGYASGGGTYVTANGAGTFAMGTNNVVANADNVFAFGKNISVTGGGTVAMGEGITGNAAGRTVFGKFNESTGTTVTFPFILGIGTSDAARDNGFAISPTGEVYAKNATINTGIDYAEAFEWADGNPDNEDRTGLFVKLEGDKISLANKGEEYIGIISATPNVVGDEGAMNWHSKYIKDDFGRVIYEDVLEEAPSLTEKQASRLKDLESKSELNERESNRLMKLKAIRDYEPKMITRPKLNPDYSADTEYVPRSARKEWSNVGLLGQLRVQDDNTANAGDNVVPTTGGIATKSNEGTGYKVIKRIKEGIVQVLVK